MTEARKFRVRNRLRAAMFDGGGKLVGQALKDSEALLCSLAPACEQSMRDTIALIDQTYGPRAVDRNALRPASLYSEVIKIIDSSACSSRRGLVEACSSLCDLLDACEEAKVWDWPAVDVHIAALQCLIADTTLGDADRLKIVGGLAALRRHRTPDRSGQAD